ncbi:CLUMA_CG005883, isoform A [Clunio marinus]|uniref:CLUMA_CG005883, isoform A n=1 Tax=Clunio marinus TaxID=568069 RepID=A0A1J1HWC0_9DIPT|nr:CLUMA_CG005883, isoform A [Clunio marinus]
MSKTLSQLWSQSFNVWKSFSFIARTCHRMIRGMMKCSWKATATQAVPTLSALNVVFNELEIKAVEIYRSLGLL